MTLHEIYQVLLSQYGHRGWWPAETIDEIVIGAILTQNVSWSNVEKAIKALRANKLLSLGAIYLTSQEDIAKLIVPTRYYNQKAQTLKNYAEFLHEVYHGSHKEMFQNEAAYLRKKLLQVKGIGRETADSILLYAGNKLQFVSDAYTARMLGRLGVIPDKCSYDVLVSLAIKQIPADVELYKDLHAQIVHYSAVTCKAKPHCEACILNGFCCYDSSWTQTD